MSEQEINNKEGRPPVFSSPEEMESRIMEYFSNCPDKKKIVAGNGTIEVPAITITGLCIYLGFESRQSFYDYEKREEFSYIIKKARLRVENYYEQCLQFGNVTGAIFPLKNMGWSDRTELTGADGKDLNPHFTIELIDSSDKVDNEESTGSK